MTQAERRLLLALAHDAEAHWEATFVATNQERYMNRAEHLNELRSAVEAEAAASARTSPEAT